ncbi:DUF3048 domain-containing protein [Streptomyces lavendofoliae]|uniref:DUF3048 domain-containing protein n=1 Tax=Streptomyces lavendofoliae TaxID=67314 RepID=A0A918M682_9ACTN|nr:DUF3048 domain-containing protein [Streptomyces lavendofoliae]GGU48591.1 hypothetical protein GCM10010274_41630 [Streptomyces lavendofoliae]
MRVRRGSGRTGAAVAAVMCAAMTAGLSSCSGTGPAPATSVPPSPPGRGVSPFTGLPAALAPVLAVKIDNVRPARPHTGLGAADIVYVEQVESGQTRLLAVYSSRLPSRVGPVRSARESDLELLRQFGRPALAYSGEQSALRPLIDAAPLFALAPRDAPRAYARGQDRPAPHNLYVRPERVLAAAPRADAAKDIGFRFGAEPPGGRRVNEHTVRYPAARFTFTWSATGDRWLVAMDGSPARGTDGERAAARTVVVQDVDVRPSRFRDRGGNVTPYTSTVGSGTALVLRDGRSHDARWSRPSADGATTFTTPAGEPLTFAPGQVWVVLKGR